MGIVAGPSCQELWVIEMPQYLRAMNTRNTPRIPLLIHFALLIILTVLAAFTARAESPEAVTIRGWLHAGESNLSDALVVVELNGESCVRSVLLRNGRFEFELPVNAKARLVFEKPGYLSKEVLVDTRNAKAGSRANKANRTVKFEVVLEEETRYRDHVYMGPVGTIDFVNGTGTMKVRYFKQLTAFQEK